ncbi:hypothetical protein VPH35_094441 [Triticum aestivum]
MARVSVASRPSPVRLQRLLSIVHRAPSRPLLLLDGAPSLGVLARVGLDGGDPDPICRERRGRRRSSRGSTPSTSTSASMAGMRPPSTVTSAHSLVPAARSDLVHHAVLLYSIQRLLSVVYLFY